MRRRGLIPRSAGRALLVRAAVVHSFGMDQPITIVGIDVEGTVVSSSVLPPRRLAVLRGASWALELPPDEPSPPVGSRLRLVRPLT